MTCSVLFSLQYHDLGLIVAYLSTLSAGGEGFYMAPMDFIRSPAAWVQLMSSLKVLNATVLHLSVCCTEIAHLL